MRLLKPQVSKALGWLSLVALVVLALFGLWGAPPDKVQSDAQRLMYLHVPTAWIAYLAFGVTALTSALWLWKRTRATVWDRVAGASAEIGVLFTALTLVLGSLWGRPVWGIWWAWDARLTTMLVCWLIYAGYVMLRRAIDEPTERARLSAVVSIFGCVDIMIVWKSIEWWRTQHPAPVLSVRDGGGMAPGMEAPIYWNWLALMCLAAILVMVRMRQEDMSRQIDSLRRMAHTY
jgi:heme exporter protein C